MVLRCASESGRVSYTCAVIAVVVSRRARVLRGVNIAVHRRVLQAIGSRAILDVALNIDVRSLAVMTRFPTILLSFPLSLLLQNKRSSSHGSIAFVISPSQEMGHSG